LAIDRKPSSRENQLDNSNAFRRVEPVKSDGLLASDADMTMRAFVLNALKEKGLSVREDDLIDLRKERR
jgi:adenine specific DNA methylase Mod